MAVSGNMLVCGNESKEVLIWDLTQCKLLKTLIGHTQEILGISLVSQFVASSSADSTIKLWNIQTYELLHTFKGHETHVSGVCISPNGKLIASCSQDRTVKLWDLETK